MAAPRAGGPAGRASRRTSRFPGCPGRLQGRGGGQCGDRVGTTWRPGRSEGLDGRDSNHNTSAAHALRGNRSFGRACRSRRLLARVAAAVHRAAALQRSSRTARRIAARPGGPCAARRHGNPLAGLGQSQPEGPRRGRLDLERDGPGRLARSPHPASFRPQPPGADCAAAPGGGPASSPSARLAQRGRQRCGIVGAPGGHRRAGAVGRPGVAGAPVENAPVGFRRHACRSGDRPGADERASGHAGGHQGSLLAREGGYRRSVAGLGRPRRRFAGLDPLGRLQR